MIIKGIRDEDFLQYKLASMFVAFPSCTFKCERECEQAKGMCQNGALVKAPDIECTPKDIVDRYISNPISKAMVCGGLEPFDSFEDLYRLLAEFRSKSSDPFIIYTGYNKDEVQYMTFFRNCAGGTVEYSVLESLKKLPNVIIKYGRFIPNQKPHYDEVLGVELASPNQYAEKIS